MLIWAFLAFFTILFVRDTAKTPGTLLYDFCKEVRAAKRSAASRRRSNMQPPRPYVGKHEHHHSK